MAKAKAETKKPLLLDKSVYKVGTLVKYTGTRVKEHSGLTGTITGYRGPTTGLVVKFSNGYGSISCRNAQVVTKAVRKAKAAATPAPAETPNSGE